MTNLKIAYMALSLIMVVILIAIGRHTNNKSFNGKSLAMKKTGILALGLILWQVYVYFIAKSGVLDNFGFPPRFWLFLIMPLFVFTGIFIYRNRKKDWIINIPEHWLVFYQSFRIVIETIFVYSVAEGILNKEVTFEGYNMDMLFGYSALLIGILFYKKIISRKIVIIWNYLGLIVISVIIFLFLASIFAPELFGSETMILPPEAVKYPYVLVAGFLMPSAVFMHVLSIVQLRRKQKSNPE